MDTNDFILAHILPWLGIILILIVVFREKVKNLIGAIRKKKSSIDMELSFGKRDKHKVEEIIKKGSGGNDPPGKIAERIMQLFDKKETRILRALFDDAGRKIYSYRSPYYRDALDSLIRKGFVAEEREGYALTNDGFRFTAEYLQRIINDQ
jgi:hypothetical protein